MVLTTLFPQSQTVAKNRANWDDIVKRLSKDYRCIREKVLCCVENEEKGVQKLRDALLRLCRLRMEAAPSCLKVVPKSCLNFLARINSYRNRFLVSAPFVMEIADECGVPPERVDEYIQVFCFVFVFDSLIDFFAIIFFFNFILFSFCLT